MAAPKLAVETAAPHSAPEGPTMAASPTVASFPQAWDRERAMLPSTGGEPPQLLEALLRENRELREQKEAKCAELVQALRAQHVLEKSYAEALEERQALESEVKHLQQKIGDMEQSQKEDQRLRSESLAASAQLQQKLQEAEGMQKQMELRLAEQKERLKDTEEKLRHSDARAATAERAAKVCERLTADVCSEKAKETEQQCQIRAEKETMECRLKYAELGAARQREMQAALLELQSLARGQELLRAELSRALRPLPAKPLGSYLAPPLRPLPHLPAAPPTAGATMIGASPLRQAARSSSSPFETMQREWRSPPSADEELNRRSPMQPERLFEPLSRSFRALDEAARHHGRMSPEMTADVRNHRDTVSGVSPGAVGPRAEQSCH